MSTTTEKHCTRCGKPGPFANERKLRCKACDKKEATHRKLYLRRYQRARSAASNRLIHARPGQFRRLLDEELDRVNREAEESEEVA